MQELVTHGARSVRWATRGPPSARHGMFPLPRRVCVDIICSVSSKLALISAEIATSHLREIVIFSHLGRSCQNYAQTHLVRIRRRKAGSVACAVDCGGSTQPCECANSLPKSVETPSTYAGVKTGENRFALQQMRRSDEMKAPLDKTSRMNDCSL